jgi:ketosteroid isomerase-like protein
LIREYQIAEQFTYETHCPESIKEEENLTVRVYQNSAVATSRVTIKGQYSGQPISGQYRSTHVWVKGPTGWQLVSNQLTALPPK